MRITGKNIVIFTIVLFSLLIAGCNTNSIPSQENEPTNSATIKPITTVKPTIKPTPDTISEDEAILKAKKYTLNSWWTLSLAVGNVQLTDFPTVTYASNTGIKNGYYQILVKGYFYGTDDYGTKHKYYFDWTIEVDENSGYTTGKTPSVK